MAVTARCTHCQASVQVESDAFHGEELTCPMCQRRFVPTDLSGNNNLDLDDLAMDVDTDDLFADLPESSMQPTSLQPPQIPSMAKAKAKAKIGPDGLTDSQRQYGPETPEQSGTAKR